ncbi:hypothetical protein EDC01DRAFT_657877 [Geopyxis carbonaria]|nr:hypothetical protein EDC01DRAFT_657877 [Geopyxis carbonaria]
MASLVRPILRGFLRPGSKAFRHAPTAPQRYPSPCPSCRQLSSTSALTRNKAAPPPPVADVQPEQAFEKKPATRKTTSKSSLRRAAVVSDRRAASPVGTTKICTAYCTADKYDIALASRLLRAQSHTVDPHDTGLADQVLHLQLPLDGGEVSDVFIFPSGNIVGWSVPSSQISALAFLLAPAAETSYTTDVETENLEYVEDPRVRRSRVGGDVIILGTASAENHLLEHGEIERSPADERNLTLAKVAFSSGLARSTKLGVLETLLDAYLETTSEIPLLLSRGSRLPYTRSFILRKTGELLQFRAQLNLYSELTDSLPDIFWDSRHELGLEGYYEGVGRALDVDVRIRQLNEKLDYASGIVEVLRERLSERHGIGLEWMIIVLITVEVGFEVLRLWKERAEERSEEGQFKRWKEREEREGNAAFQAWRKSGGEILGSHEHS